MCLTYSHSLNRLASRKADTKSTKSKKNCLWNKHSNQVLYIIKWFNALMIPRSEPAWKYECMRKVKDATYMKQLNTERFLHGRFWITRKKLLVWYQYNRNMITCKGSRRQAHNAITHTQLLAQRAWWWDTLHSCFMKTWYIAAPRIRPSLNSKEYLVYPNSRKYLASDVLNGQRFAICNDINEYWLDEIMVIVSKY